MFKKFSYAIILAFLGLILYNLIDRPLDPAAAEFFKADPFIPQGNVYTAWAGIHAPQNIQDIETYVMFGDIDPDSKVLRFEGEAHNICTEQDNRSIEPCLSYADIQKLMAQNAELIGRYQTLYAGEYRSYSKGDSWYLYGIYGQDMIAIQRVLNAHWIELARKGKGQEAIDAWLLNTKWLQKMIGGKAGFVDESIYMIVYGLNLRTLPIILHNNKPLIIHNEAALISLLNKDFFEIWDVRKTAQVEVRTLDSVKNMYRQKFWAMPFYYVLYKPNDTYNKFYRFAVMLEEYSKDPHYDTVAFDLLSIEYSCSILFECIPYNVTGGLLVPGMIKGYALLGNGHAFTGYQRALILWMMAKSQDIPLENMADFLEQSDPSLYDPFTQQPFVWNAQSKAIVYAFRDFEKLLYY